MKGLSQNRLAAIIGVHRSAVTHWESKTGGKWPSQAHLAALAQATDTRLDWLATGRGRPEISDAVRLDLIAAADAVLVEDDAEIRLVRAFRAMPVRARVALIETAELFAGRTPAARRPATPRAAVPRSAG